MSRNIYIEHGVSMTGVETVLYLDEYGGALGGGPKEQALANVNFLGYRIIGEFGKDKGPPPVFKRRRRGLEAPEGLSPDGQRAMEAIIKALPVPLENFAKAEAIFHNPKEWTGDYGQDSLLVVSYGDGDVAHYFSLDADYACRYKNHEKMRQALETAGFWAEECTSAYTAVYKS